MKKIFLFIFIITCTMMLFAFVPGTPALADTGNSVSSETWSDAALNWWNANQSAIASYGAMIMSTIASAVIVRIKSKNNAVTASVDDSNRSVRKVSERIDVNNNKLDAVLTELKIVKADIAITKAQSEKSSKNTYAAIKMLAQVYVSSGVPDYVKSEIMETYKASIDDTETSEKAINEANSIVAQLAEAKANYEVKVNSAEISIENYR